VSEKAAPSGAAFFLANNRIFVSWQDLQPTCRTFLPIHQQITSKDSTHGSYLCLTHPSCSPSCKRVCYR